MTSVKNLVLKGLGSAWRWKYVKVGKETMAGSMDDTGNKTCGHFKDG